MSQSAKSNQMVQKGSNQARKKLSKYRGVRRRKSGTFGAEIRVKGKYIWIGTFDDEIDAAMAYDETALEHGSKASNFPKLVQKGSNQARSKRKRSKRRQCRGDHGSKAILNFPLEVGEPEPPAAPVAGDPGQRQETMPRGGRGGGGGDNGSIVKEEAPSTSVAKKELKEEVDEDPTRVHYSSMKKEEEEMDFY